MKNEKCKSLCQKHVWDREEYNPHCHYCGLLMRDDGIKTFTAWVGKKPNENFIDEALKEFDKEFPHKIAEVIDDFGIPFKSEVRDFFSEKLQEAYDSGFLEGVKKTGTYNQGYQAGLDEKNPMGVSEWRKYGERYAYWGYFKSELIKELIAEIKDQKEKDMSQELFCKD